MDVQVTVLGGIPLLELEGDIDHGNSTLVESALREMLDSGSRLVLVDLTHVGYMDSGGISALFYGIRRLREKGWLGVIGPNHDLSRLFELVGLYADPSFRVFEDRPAAQEALAEEAGR